MTPKEKAEHLVGFYLIKVRSLSCIADAKICALIALDEIIRIQVTKNGYWQEVKQEINNL
jgi:hypothetical protein